jgi:pentatricopeptide repeat protein
LILVCFLSCFIPVSLEAATLDDMFRGGVNSYEAGNYEAACKVFREMHERYGVSSPDLLVNLGASEFGAGRVGRAILYFHKAIEADRDSLAADVARVNLERVRSALNLQQGSGGGKSGFVFGPYSDVWTAVFGRLPSWAPLATFLRFWTFALIVLGTWRLVRDPAWKRRLLVAFAVVSLATVAAGVCAFGAYRASSVKPGVILADRTALLDSPASIEPAMTLPEGLEVRVVESRGGFVRVLLPSGREGFVAEKAIGVP